MFLCRLLDTAHSAQELESTVPISGEAAKDIEWWLHFAKAWNGIALFLEPHWTPSPQFELFTDASGTLGFGAYWNGAWFSGMWSAELASKPIEWKELYAIVMACQAWGGITGPLRSFYSIATIQRLSAVVSFWESGLSQFGSDAPGQCLIPYSCQEQFFNCRCPFSPPATALESAGPSCDHAANTHPCQSDIGLTIRLNCLQALSTSTRRTYQAGVKAFTSFCAASGISVLPVSELTLRYFCVKMSLSVSAQTIRVYLAGIRPAAYRQ